MNENIRDLSVTFLTEELGVIVACDSSGAIGLKEQDQVEVPPEITSAFCLRVPLMEILAVGGVPKIVVDTISNEMNPTGNLMLTGINTELKKAGFDDVLINGSTEENMTTTMTSIGVTVIGSIEKKSFVYGKIIKGSSLYQVGYPYVGEAVLKKQDQIFSYQDLLNLRKQEGVLEMIPVGSKGILYEANQLAKSSKLIFKENNQAENLTQSAGPATVLLVAVDKEVEPVLLNDKIPIKKIGTFIHEN